MTPVNVTSSKPRILIVDDEPFNVDLLEQELGDLGYETDSASNGREALDKVALSPPDLILLDVIMPVMDGFQACSILKDDEKTKLIPVVIVTSLHSKEDRLKGIEADANAFLTKPVDEDELRAIIRSALRQKKSMDDQINQERRARDHYAKFVPEVVKRLIDADPDSPELAKREQDASVLFADICEYTRLSESLSPTDLNDLVERYFSEYLDRIHHLDGDLTQTAGDGIMAVFHGLTPLEHACRSMDAALALMTATATLNAELGGPQIKLHIGIGSGIAAVGATRFEGRSGTRWVFTADGLVANLASRLSDYAGPGQILVGPETVRRLGHLYSMERVGFLCLKNIVEPVEAYSVTGKRDQQ